jgi:hypothetical protein
MNSKLYDSIIILPDSLIKHLGNCFGTVNGNTNTEGWKRNQELRQSKQITYQQLKRVKNWFDSYSGNKEDAPFILNGGDRMQTWCNHALDQMRNGIESGKQLKADTGMQNQFIKAHNKLGTGDQNLTTVQSLEIEKVNEEISNINKLMKKII